MWQAGNGIYGPNLPDWPEDCFERIKLGRFKWAIVRLDTDPAIAERLQRMGLTVIVQAPDTFNRENDRPWKLAEELWERALPFHKWASWICLDNEPNLNCERNNWWWAGQFTRWYRSLQSDFRYWDSWTGYWRIIHPALCQAKGSNWENWLQTGIENWRDADAISAHSYWQTDDTYLSPDFGSSWKAIHAAFPNKPLFITEYAPDMIWLTPRERAIRMQRYLMDTEGHAQASCYFILDGTPEWKRYFLSRDAAIELGAMV